MDDRKLFGRELASIEEDLRVLQIRYEQYFAGVEKREPVQDRESLTRRLRQFANRRIMQTDLRFKYQNLATRYHSFSGHWDRILRLMDEGKYVRQTAKLQRTPPPATSPKSSSAGNSGDEVDSVLRDLTTARQSLNLQGPAPDRNQVAKLIDQQRQKIREKFGDRQVEFRVVTEDGRPKIKVRAKS